MTLWVMSAAVGVGAVAVPWLRRAILSVIGLLAIVALGAVALGGFIWALYEAKTVLLQEIPVVTERRSIDRAEEGRRPGTRTVQAGAAGAREEPQELGVDGKEGQDQPELEPASSSSLVLAVQAVLEEDRRMMEQELSSPLAAQADPGDRDLMVVRIPAWRDEALSARQRASIRSWLQSIGVGGAETKSIVTAKAWGSLYDMWIAENPGVVAARLSLSKPRNADDLADVGALDDPGEETETPPEEPGYQPGLDFVQELPAPRRVEPYAATPPQRSSPSADRQLPERGVGPFGY